MTKHTERFFLSEIELMFVDENDLWGEVNYVLAREKIKPKDGVTILELNPHWDPGFEGFKLFGFPKPVFHGLYLTLEWEE